MVGTASTAPVTVFIGPTCHLNGIDRLAGQRRYHHCHTGRPAAVGADVVGAVGLARVPLVQLIIVDHLRRAIRETNVAQRYKAGGLGRQQALHHTIAQEYAQVLGVVFRQSLLFIRQSEYLILKIGLSVVDDGIDLPYLCYFRFRHRDLTGFGLCIRFRYRSRARLLRAREGIESVLGLTDYVLHILEGDRCVVLIFGGTVHGNEAVGIVGRGAFVWIDDLLLVGTGSGKIRVNTGANILLPFLQQVADRLRDLIYVLHNGGVVVEDRCVWTSFNPCLGQPAEDQGRQQHDEQDGKHQHPGNDGSNRLAMCPECRCRRTVRACGSSTFCRAAYHFSCLDGAAHSAGSVCADLSGFVQTAAFLLGHIRSCPFCEAGQADAGSGSHDRKCRHPDSDKAFSPLRPVRTAYTTLHHPRW